MILWGRGLGLPPPGTLNCVCSSWSAGRSPQRWSDVFSVSLQSLQVDERYPLHLDRKPAKRLWSIAACVRVVSFLVPILWIIFLCCVVGTAKKALAVLPHCGIIFQNCCRLRSSIIFISFLISLYVHGRARCERWMATAFTFPLLSTTSVPGTP